MDAISPMSPMTLIGLSVLSPEAILVFGGLLLLLWEAFGQPNPRSIGLGVIGFYLLAGFSMVPHLGIQEAHLGAISMSGISWPSLVNIFSS